MKKYILLIGILSSVITRCFAQDQMETSAIATQAWHQQAVSAAAPGNNETKAVAQVEKVMQAAHQYQVEKQQPDNERNLANPALAVSSSALLYQQEVNHNVEQLAVQNQQLQANLAKLRLAFILLNQEVNGLNEQIVQLKQHDLHAQNKSSFITKSFLWLRAYLAANLVYFVVGATIFLIVLLLVLLFPRKKTDLEEEYDYMRTPQAVPSQLDLARAYIAMEDFIAAKATLNEVIKRGNVDQQQQAHELLAKIG